MMTFREIDTDQFYDALWWPQRTLSFSCGNVTHPLWCWMQPPPLQHAKCTISITQQRPNCAFNCSETREIKAKTSKWWRKSQKRLRGFREGSEAWTSIVTITIINGNIVPSASRQSGSSGPVMCKLHISATSAMNKSIELIMIVEQTCFQQLSAGCCSIL